MFELLLASHPKNVYIKMPVIDKRLDTTLYADNVRADGLNLDITTPDTSRPRAENAKGTDPVIKAAVEADTL
jgi:hypothetical protein